MRMTPTWIGRFGLERLKGADILIAISKCFCEFQLLMRRWRVSFGIKGRNLIFLYLAFFLFFLDTTSDQLFDEQPEVVASEWNTALN